MCRDVVIIGGGIAGLTCATLLAQQGERVTLVERAPQVAPLVRGFVRRGLYFDTGFHYAGALGDGEILARLCRHLGLAELLAQRLPCQAAGFDRVRGTPVDREFTFPCGWARLTAALTAAFPAHAQPLARYLADVRTLIETIPDAMLRGELGRETRLPASADVSLQEYLDRAFGADEWVKLVLAAHGVLYGGEPQDISFRTHALIAGSYYQSAHTLRGGGRTIADAFARRLAALGVTVRTGTAARRLRFTPAGALAGVELADGEVLDAARCVLATHPRELLRLAPRAAFRPAYRHRVAALPDSHSAFLLYGRQTAGTAHLAGCNLLLFNDATPATLRHATRRPLARRPLFVAASGEPAAGAVVVICPAAWATARAWRGAGTDDRAPGYAAWKAGQLAAIATRLRAVAGDVVGDLDVVDGATPLTFATWAGAPRGGLYGVRHTLGEVELGPRTRLPGVFLSGQAVVLPGLLGAMLSGFATGAAMCGPERWRQEWCA